MGLVVLTAVGVGSATFFGSVIGFVFREFSKRFSVPVLSFSAGVMLAATVWGLIDPALDYGVNVTVLGIISGAVFLHFLNKIAAKLGKCLISPEGGEGIEKVVLFVAAIAIHNIPEGFAAGVGFGTGDTAQALTIAGGIALQNIPEGMVIIGPLLAVGADGKKTFLCALFSGLVEIIGTMVGYYAVSIASAIMPFALSFAGGTMLYVITDEMIPDTHKGADSQAATYSLISGFIFTLVFNAMLA